MIPRLPGFNEPVNFSTEQQKYINDAVRNLRQSQFYQTVHIADRDDSALGNVIKGFNEPTGLIEDQLWDGHVPWYGIVKLKNCMRDYETRSETDLRSVDGGFENEICFNFWRPDAASVAGEWSDQVLAIAQNPISRNTVGNLMIQGVTQVRIMVPQGGSDYKWAFPNEDNVEYLTAAEAGPIEIVWLPEVSPGEEGEIVWGLVRLPASGPPVIWVKATTNWIKPAGPPSLPYPWVPCTICDINGDDIDAPELSLEVILPLTGCGMPNVVEGDVFAACKVADGKWTAVSDYLDAQFGEITWFSGTEEAIGPGWHICDGEGGTVDLRDRFIVATGNEYSLGNTGGFKNHGPGADNNHIDHLISSEFATHTHPEHIFAVPNPVIFPHGQLWHDQLADHDNHRHAYDTNSDKVAAGVDGGEQAFDANPGANTWTSGVAKLPKGGNNLLNHSEIGPHDELLHLFGLPPFVTLDHLPSADMGGGEVAMDHTMTDNRPPYYALLAKQRIDNSTTGS